MRRSVKLCLYALTLAALVLGAVGAANVDKTITVAVDGHPRHVRSSASTVRGVLHDAGLRVGRHDVIAPELSTRVHAGSLVELRRGRLLRLVVDGASRDVWTTDTTVDQALADLGYGQGRTVGVSRDRRLPLTPTDITLVLPKPVTILADKEHYDLVTTALTVREAIEQARLHIGAADRISPAADEPPQAGMHIVLTRVRLKTETVVQRVPFTIKTRRDSSQYRGTTTVLRAGRDGQARVTYRLVFLNGKFSDRVVLHSTVIRAPVTQTQTEGSKSPEAGSPAAARLLAKSMVAERGWDDSQYQCLVLLWTKESGWRTNAANPSGAYGIPQALPGSKMASAGPSWQTDAHTQIAWGLGYIAHVYGTPCTAWAHSQATNWYLTSPVLGHLTRGLG